jgi:hypothetical protein
MPRRKVTYSRLESYTRYNMVFTLECGHTVRKPGAKDFKALDCYECYRNAQKKLEELKALAAIEEIEKETKADGV